MFNGTDNEFLNVLRKKMNNPMNAGGRTISEHLIDNGTSKTRPISEAEISIKSEFNKNFSISEPDAVSMMNSSNIFMPEQIHDNRYNKFARYGILDPYNTHMSSREYIFFTKPDLHIFSTGSTFTLYNPLSKIPLFESMKDQFPEALLSLQQTYSEYDSTKYPNNFNVKNKYIPLLSNHVSSTLDFPAITGTETQNNMNLYQINTSYRDGSEISDCAFDFTLEFTDTKYLDVYMLFKAYDEFIRQEYRKEIRPTKNCYTKYKVNWKQFSMYKIIVDDTNTIMFFGKVTAVQPMGVPRDSMSNFDGPIKITVPFKGQFISDQDPIFLREINHLTALSLNRNDSDMRAYAMSHALPLYNNSTATSNTEWGAYPYIIKKSKKVAAGNTEGNLFKLIWIN